MKKLFFLALLIATVGSVSAQTYYYPRRVHRRPVERHRRDDDFYRTRVGIEGGLSIANTVDSYDENYNTSNILGFHAGITVTVPILKPLSFQPEVLFSQKGYKAYYTDGTGTFTQRNNYIDVPLLANFQLVRGFNFLVGPQLNFPISTTNTFTDNFNFSKTQESYYTDSNNKSLIAGVVGFSFDLTPNVDLHARYVIDLSSNTQDPNSPIAAYRNQVWQFGIGIKFQ